MASNYKMAKSISNKSKSDSMISVDDPNIPTGPIKEPKEPKKSKELEKEFDEIEIEPDIDVSFINNSLFCRETINKVKLQYIIENFDKYEYIIKEQEKAQRRYKNYSPLKALKKLLTATYQPEELIGTEFAYINVQYKKGDESNGIGREYAVKSIGLQSLILSIRHTVCLDIWTDIDQVNSHPSILKILFDKHGVKSKMLNYCIKHREDFLKKVNDNRDTAKTDVISLINGGVFPVTFQNNKANTVLVDFEKDLKPGLDIIINKPEYKSILDSVKNLYNVDENGNDPKGKYVNISGKVISRILQVIENDLLMAYVEWANSKGFLGDDNEIALIFDGFQILSKYNITDEHLRECELYALDKTGYFIELKIKEFDNPLDLPSDYAISLIANDINGFINLMKNKVNDEFIYKYGAYIDQAIDSMSHFDTITFITKIVKDRLYCENHKTWFHCNANNIWEELDQPYILNAIIPTVGVEIVKLKSKEWVVQALNPKLDPDVRQRWLKKAEKAEKLINHLKNATFTKACISYTDLFIKLDFNKKYLDNNTHLFAFDNKVFDFKANVNKPSNELKLEDFMRPIKPTDYIKTSTGYDFPEEDSKKDIALIVKFLDDLFPVFTEEDDEDGPTQTIGEGKKKYVLNIFATSLNGSNTEQSVFFHNGKGSNGKTTLFEMLGKVFGDYYCSVGASTFTEKEKANGNGESYRFEGKRFGTFNEVDSNTCTQLQAPAIKKWGDVGETELKGKRMYQQEYYFKNQSTLHGCMNNKPTLSSVDGGVARRVKIIDYTTQFVEEPINVNYERLKDPNFILQIKDDGIRNAFIRMLLNLWITDVRQNAQVKVPQCVIDASSDYCDECNFTKRFILEKYDITTNKKDKEKSSILYTAFKEYMKENGNDIVTNDKKFKEEMLTIKGVDFKKTNIGNCYTNLKLKDDKEKPIKYNDIPGHSKEEDFFRNDSDNEAGAPISDKPEDNVRHMYTCKDGTIEYGMSNNEWVQLRKETMLFKENEKKEEWERNNPSWKPYVKKD